MASSGDYTWNPSTYAIITGAMRLIGAIQTGETPPAEEWEDALAALNGVIHAWQANGLHVWTQATIDIPLTAGKDVYQIGIGAPDIGTAPRPLKITEGRYIVVDGGEVHPLISMSRWDYANLSGKVTPPGVPTNYFYDPQLPFGYLFVYPTPASSGLIRVLGQRPLQAFDTQRNTADVPQEWISALRFALAVDLGPEYDVPAERLKIIKELSDEKLQTVRTWDTEAGGTTTLPYTQAVYQLIAGALRLCGGCGPQDTPNLGLINNGFYSLNAMVQQWQASGIHIWTESDATLFLQPLQNRYLIGVGSPDHCCLSNEWKQTYLTQAALAGDTVLQVGTTTGVSAADHIGIIVDQQGTQLPQYFWTTVVNASANTVVIAAPLPSQASASNRVVTYTNDLIRPLRVPAARRMLYAGNLGFPTKIETPMSVYSRIDYSQQPNKDTPGEVTAYFYDPQLGFGVFHTWPNPAGSNQAVQFTVQLPLTTYTDLTTTGNFPSEWTNAIRYSLAVELWPEHAERRATILKSPAFATFQELKLLADEKLQMAMAHDREPESIYFGLQSFPDARNT